MSLKPMIPLSGSSGRSGPKWRSILAHFDWTLFVGLVLIALLGLLNLYSAVHDTAHSAKFDKQLSRMVFGFVCFAVVASLDYRATLRFAWFALGGIVLALLAVFIIGDTSKGSSRWLNLGIRIQPSEMAKIVVILVVARLLHERGSDDERLWMSALRWFAVCIPIALVLRQPDLGTASLTGLIALSMVLLMKRDLKWVYVSMFAIVVLGFLLFDSMHDYQRNRILAFLDPSADPTGVGWNAKQSILAVGSGKMFGKGFLEATQNSFNFLPEYWTDFPFSVWAEEWGFVGAIFLLLLYGFLIFRCIQVALSARDRFGAAICVGVAAMIFWHASINIMMVLGLAPVVGVTLPFISYGGSSVITFWICLGLVASVSRQRTKN